MVRRGARRRARRPRRRRCRSSPARSSSRCRRSAACAPAWSSASGSATRHLALACASHGGSPAHVGTVAEVLAACGLRDEALALRAGAAARPARRRRRAALADRAQLLGQARLRPRALPGRGLAAGRLLPRRPSAAGRDARLRRRGLRARPADRGGDRRLRDADLRGAAGGARGRAFGGLAGDGLGPAGVRCAGAMRGYPELVGYEGAIDTELMRAEPGLVAKIGAEGVLAMGLPDGRGLALKVRDGSLAGRRARGGRAGPRGARARGRRARRARLRPDLQLARDPGRRAPRRPLVKAVLERALDRRRRARSAGTARAPRLSRSGARARRPARGGRARSAAARPGAPARARRGAARAAAGRARRGRAGGPRPRARSRRRR